MRISFTFYCYYILFFLFRYISEKRKENTYKLQTEYLGIFLSAT